ncbi:MAG TPA: succinate dehydrogenase cytochrome b subunit [Balneolaceae bacterium]|nr:succinate dehydrogenase cytochrome b subunit [Balneolaceae bacterium]
MPSITEALNSQIGRKLLTGITGILLLLFVIVHLAGNLAIFGEADAMNEYSLFLHSLGPLLWIARIGLLLAFLIHAWIGISIWWNKRKARPQKYEVYSSKGGPSKQSISSRSMAFTGIVLLIFVIIHLDTFALGDTETVMINGQEASDIKQLVIDTFQSPIYAFGYTIVMILLGVHLGHGVWSSFTSLTMKSKKMSASVYAIGIAIAILLAIGFLFIPLYIYFTGGEGSLISY